MRRILLQIQEYFEEWGFLKQYKWVSEQFIEALLHSQTVARQDESMSVQQSYEESQEQNPEKEKQIIFREIAKAETPIK